MSFWILKPSKHAAVITPQKSYTYEQLQNDVELFRKKWKSDKKNLILLLCENKYEMIVAYIAALRAGHAVMLLSADTAMELLIKTIKSYQPAWIYGSCHFLDYEKIGEKLWRRPESPSIDLHPDLALLLSTSGTTGSQKFVRLSYDNIQSNAGAIVDYLSINEQERGVMNLPLSYSYGMSIVNSHLKAGATILLTSESIVSKTFWTFISKEKATSLPGVPFTYQMLHRIGFVKMNLPYLKTLTQAGGHLDERLVTLFGQYAAENGKRFYVMYGQTEASPRMSYIPSSQLLQKVGTIGVAIPGGSFEINKETSELLYKGKNVMMGYAQNVGDLIKGDDLGGILHTGDIATVDKDGFYSLKGRLSRFIKLFGLRVNMDEMERQLVNEFQCTIVCTGTDDSLIVVTELEELTSDIKAFLESVYQLHKSAFTIYAVPSIPRFVNGKVNYSAIKEGLT